MKKSVMIMGLALCSTLAMAQTTNRTESRLDDMQFTKPVSQKSLVNYKASIFTKDDDTVYLFHFDEACMTEMGTDAYGLNAVLSATDVVDTAAIGSTLAHAQTSKTCTWQHIPDSAYVSGNAFAADYPQMAAWDVLGINSSIFGGEYAPNDGFMLMVMVEVGTAAGAINAYFELPERDLPAGADVIDVNFTQLFWHFNRDHCYIDYKIGNTWKSREINVLGVDCQNSEWATVQPSYTMPFELADPTVNTEGKIKLRFRWACNNSTGGAYGYFWTVDEVAIVTGDAYRMKRYSQAYLDGGYGIMPKDMRIPLSWYAQVANNGLNDISNVNLNFTHGTFNSDGSFGESELINAYNPGQTFAYGDPSKQYYTYINERHFLDSIEGQYWYQMYGWNLGGTYGTNFVPQNYYGLPVENNGAQYVQVSLSNEDIDTIYWPRRTYTVVGKTSGEYNNGDENGRIEGYRWGHDNGVITNRSAFHHGFDSEGINLSDTNHYQNSMYTVALRYTTGSEIPVDGNGDPWVLLGLEIIPSTDSRDMDQMNNSEIFPLVYLPSFDEDGWMNSISVLNTGYSQTRPYVVNTAKDANNADIRENYFLTPAEPYNAVTIKFPAQPELEPNQTYYIGYEMANPGFFCPATTSSSYVDEGTSTRAYFTDDANLYKYAYMFNPEGMDILMYDPDGDGYLKPFVASSVDNYPMIRAIVGPRMQLERYEIQANCGSDQDSQLYSFYQNNGGSLEPVCDLPSGSLMFNEGESTTLYLFPGVDGNEEHYIIDSIIITGSNSGTFVCDPWDASTWPEDVYIEGVEYHYMNPADTTQVALFRHRYVLSFEEMSENKTVSVVAHWEPWHIGIDPVAANVALGVQPNPATNQVKVNVAGVTGMVNCSIIDMSGRTVYNKDINAEQTHTIDLTSFARGAYFVRVTNDSFSKVEKLIVR